MNPPELSPEQFSALAELTGMHTASPTHQALRLVMVDGQRPVDAAAACGIGAQGVRNALSAARKKVVLAGQVVDSSKTA